MRAAVYHGAGRIRLTEMPVPVRTAPGDLLVRVTACGLCGSDLTAWYQDPRAPMVMGHEPVGTVLEADPHGPWRPGDRVVVHHHVPCMTCRLCRAGRHTLCPTFAATRIEPGGLAEVIMVPEANARLDVLAVPDHVDDVSATMVEPLGCVLRGLHAARVGPGSRVGVVGAGAMGLLHVAAAAALGAERIVVMEPAVPRREGARDRGALAPDELTADAALAALGDRGADAVMVTVTAPEAIDLAMGMAGPGGVVQLFAPPRPGHPVAVDLSGAWFREVTLTGTYSAGPFDTREALALIASGAVDAGALVTHRVPLHEVQRGFDLASGGHALKVAVTMPPDGS